MFLLSPGKLRLLEVSARRLLAHAASHRRHVRAHSLRSFTGLGNSTNLAVFDARLRLRELFDALAALSNSNALAPERAGEMFAARQCRPPRTLRDSLLSLGV
jgi:hypothetical protein